MLNAGRSFRVGDSETRMRVPRQTPRGLAGHLGLIRGVVDLARWYGNEVRAARSGAAYNDGNADATSDDGVRVRLRPRLGKVTKRPRR